MYTIGKAIAICNNNNNNNNNNNKVRVKRLNQIEKRLKRD